MPDAVIGSNHMVKVDYLAKTKRQATSYGLGKLHLADDPNGLPNIVRLVGYRRLMGTHPLACRSEVTSG